MLNVKIKWIFLSFLMVYSGNCLAGQWTLLSPTVMQFDGEIKSNELKKFQKVYIKTVTQLQVNSTGGDAQAGLELGSYIKNLNLEIIVDGACLSSCANYIFTAGVKKTIKNGIVCFHGNITAALNQNMEYEIRKQLKKYDLPEQEIQRIIAETRSNTKADTIHEEQFFSSLGVSQELFDRTQSLDKGMGDNKKYEFLCPRPKTFQKYGITGVRGSQNMQIGEELGLKNILN